MSLFDNTNPEEFLLFICDFKMTLMTAGTLQAGAKVQYLQTLVRGEVLRQFDFLSSGVEIVKPLT